MVTVDRWIPEDQQWIPEDQQFMYDPNPPIPTIKFNGLGPIPNIKLKGFGMKIHETPILLEQLANRIALLESTNRVYGQAIWAIAAEIYKVHAYDIGQFTTNTILKTIPNNKNISDIMTEVAYDLKVKREQNLN